MGGGERDTPKGRGTFFRVRVALLLFVLFCVVAYAVRDVRSRRARNDWQKTVDVALVLVEVRGTTPVEPAAVEALRGRTKALEARLALELRRHRPGSALEPFHFRIFGPVTADAPPPAPKGDGPIDLAEQAFALRRWLRDVDPRAGVDPDHHDTRVYLSVRRPASAERMQIEGMSEAGGRVGTVEVELDASMADLALFVATHELMHTLGATDKYDASGNARAPEGLADPAKVPLYPQAFAEIMTRARPLSPTSGVVPESIEELAVGRETAREIGW